MVDLYIGLAIIGTLSIGSFRVTRLIFESRPRWVSDLAALVLLGCMFCYSRFLWDDVRLACLLPFSNLVVVGNWFPVAAGILGGLAWTRIPGRWYRKSLSVAALTVVAGYAAVSPLLGTAPVCDDWWDAEHACVQSTQETCSPASAATLLALHGIATNEQEMAELCLTREGTSWVGLYRGLKLKTAGTPFDVQVVKCDADDVLAMGQPAILSVGLDATNANVEMRKEWGWIPGVNHTVVFMQTNSNHELVVMDPAPGYGREHWSRDNFAMLFRGIAIRLVERS